MQRGRRGRQVTGQVSIKQANQIVPIFSVHPYTEAEKISGVLGETIAIEIVNCENIQRSVVFGECARGASYPNPYPDPPQPVFKLRLDGDFSGAVHEAPFSAILVSEQRSSALHFCWNSFNAIGEQRKAGSQEENRAASFMGLERCRRVRSWTSSISGMCGIQHRPPQQSEYAVGWSIKPLSERLMNLQPTHAFVLAVFLLVGQIGYQHPIVRGIPSEKTRILWDSPEIVDLIRAGQVLRKQVLLEYSSAPLVTAEALVRHDRIATRNTQHDVLIAKLNAQPGFEVAGGTTVEIVLESSCSCDKAVLSTVYFVKIVIVNGPDKEKEGWTCHSALNDPRTNW
jgi:hypothetical protein